MKQVKLFFVAIAAICLGTMNAQSTPEPKEYSVLEIIEQAPKLVGQTVKIKGTAQHVCATSGRKLFLASPDGKKTVRINAGKAFDKFDKAVLGKQVVATGVVFEIKITMEVLDKQEAAALEAEKKQAKAEHCTSEAKANGEDTKLTAVQRIQAQKEKLKKQIEAGGKNYLSQYMVNQCSEYKAVN